MATPDIIVQVKGGKTSVITAPTGSATRLVQLADVNIAGLTDGQVLTYIAANGRYEFAVPTGAPSPDVYARPHSNGAFDHANAAFNVANTAIFTAAQIRANISNVAPIKYDATNGIISHAVSGVSAAVYGNASIVPSITVDSNGHITSAVNTTISIDASQITSNTLLQVRGGTGYAAYTNGQLLIGNTVSGGLDRATLTGGYGILVNNSNGSIEIESASGKNYYWNYSNVADVATYHPATLLPSPNAENSANIICTSSLVFTLVGAFITDPGEPGTTLLPAGAYDRHIHATTSGTTSTARLRVEVYKRAANGQETLLRTNDSPDFESDTASVLLTWTVTDPISYSLDTTDRLVFKLYAARVSGPPSVTVTIYFEGVNRASYATTSITTSTGDGVARTIANAAFNKANGVVQTGFVTINVSGQSNVVATSNVDTLKLVGSGVTITTDAPNNTITLTSAGGGSTNVGSMQLFSEPVLANSTTFLRTDASNVSVNTYSTLFGIVDRSYGSGDGVTTFTLPGIAPFVPMWIEGTAMTNPTQLATANTLSDGRILVIAGYNASSGGVFANCVFGNVSGTTIVWTQGTAFPTQRFTHASVQLPDGRMLVVAGRDQGGTVLDTTFFGNISGTTITWTAGTVLPHSTSAHTLNVLQDGRVLVTGGFNASLGVSANTYIGSVVGTTINWVQSTSLPEVKQYHNATTLVDGRILVMGGTDAGGTILRTVHFGEVSGNTINWQNGTVLPVATAKFASVLLQHAAIMMIGGSGSGWNNIFIGSIHGRGISWTQATALPLRTQEQSAVILSDKRILSLGGVDGVLGSTSNATYFATPMPWGIKF